MRRSVCTLLVSLVVSVWFVDGQLVSAKLNEEMVSVGFRSFTPSDNKGREFVAAVETDGLVTVKRVERGRLICNTLDDAKSAGVLRITLASDEVVTADRSSYNTLDNKAFTNRLSREVWTGNVRSDSGYSGYPRTIVMSWTGCSIENFQLKMVSPSKNGGVDTIVSRPSREAAGGFFIAHLHYTPKDELDVDVGGRRLDTLAQRAILAQESHTGTTIARLEDPDVGAKDSDIGLLRAYRLASAHEKEAFHQTGLRRLSEDSVVMPGGRVLEDSDKPVIDLLVLYTSNAMFGSERGSEQLETDIAASFQEANDGLAASGVDFTIRIVHMEEVAYQESDASMDALYDLRDNENFGIDVHALRDQTGADLVQLVGLFFDTCGMG